MNVETLRNFFLWCLIINTGLLLYWFAFFSLAHDWLYRFHGRWFKLPVEKFDTIHYGGMAIFKILIFVFNLAPYIALWIVG